MLNASGNEFAHYLAITNEGHVKLDVAKIESKHARTRVCFMILFPMSLLSLSVRLVRRTDSLTENQVATLTTSSIADKYEVKAIVSLCGTAHRATPWVGGRTTFNGPSL
jgi:hypothetical protein